MSVMQGFLRSSVFCTAEVLFDGEEALHGVRLFQRDKGIDGVDYHHLRNAGGERHGAVLRFIGGRMQRQIGNIRDGGSAEAGYGYYIRTVVLGNSRRRNDVPGGTGMTDRDHHIALTDAADADDLQMTVSIGNGVQTERAG